VEPVIVATTFVTIFVAELPDKSMVASMVLSTRYHRPLATWAGASAAFVLQVVLAVVAGGLLAQVPTRIVQFVTAGLFALGAIILVREGGEIERDEAAEGGPATLTGWGVAARSFGVVFVAEFGDLTQLATASLAARTGEPVSVLLGAALALCSVAAIAVVAGRAVLRVLPVLWVRRIAAAIFATLSLVTLVEVIRG
jgi:putative Ca2+/H+ antiporter (TMEM165/GDT1 family)